MMNKYVQRLIDEKAEAAQLRQQNLNIPLPFPTSLVSDSNTTFREVKSHNPFVKFWRIQGQGQYKGLNIMASVGIYGEEPNLEKLWYQVSFTRNNGMPTYEDLIWVKNNFMGKNRWCLQYFSERKIDVRFSEYCLHLWHCLEGNPLPDFRIPGIN